MPTSIENLYTKVFVRRVGVGAAPFSWEIIGANAGTPIFVSSDRFRSMEAAYSAGREKLFEFLPTKPARRERSKALPLSAPEKDWHEDWHASDNDDDNGLNFDQDGDDELTADAPGDSCSAMPGEGGSEN